MNLRFFSNFNIIPFLSFLCLSPAYVCAHNSPAELSNMSLQDLMAIQVSDTDSSSEEDRLWNLSYRYSTRQQSGHIRGSDPVSENEVLWNGVEPRTNYNFPIIVRDISQSAHQLSLSRKLSDKSSFSISAAYISQSTDHVSIVPGFEEFVISTNGWSDVTLNYSSLLKNEDGRSLILNTGVSLPTGSISKVGDTPRAEGDQIVPYNMQIGSGTFDFPLGLIYQRINTGWEFGASAAYRLRVGRNDRGYRLGNETTLDTWIKTNLNAWVVPKIRLSFFSKGRIDGEDDALSVDNANGFIYPVSMSNPDFYGGDKLRLHLGVAVPIGEKEERVTRVTLEYSNTLYEKVNGIQPKEDDQIQVSIATRF